jgi:hypothetical protein
MNVFLKSVIPTWFSKDESTVRVNLNAAQQANVHSRLRPWGLMPSSRPETTSSSRPPIPSRQVKAAGTIGRFLNQHDNIQQDPIEVLVPVTIHLGSVEV